MLVSGIKSRPTYPDRLALDPAGARHVVVGDRDSHTEIADALVRANRKLGQAPVHLLLDSTLALPSVDFPVAIETYIDLLPCLAGHLDRARMGLRLYAVGAERFVWDVAIAADAFGFGKGEVVQVVTGSIARRVFCTHCKTVNEPVTDSIHPCAGCGRRLLVRDHFSRRRGAFMAVAVDAEVPGEGFAIETLFP